MPEPVSCGTVLELGPMARKEDYCESDRPILTTTMTPVTVTYLEMRSATEFKPKWSEDAAFRVSEAKVRQWPFNRFLYGYVGGEWAWNDKLAWTDEQWREYVESPNLRTFVASYEGAIAGYYELRRSENADVQIAYFGLTPPFIGRGLGAALLSDAIDNAWKWDTQRVWVHTCTLDHPAAVSNYQSRGMWVYDVQTTDVV
jgi:GNAT superfamily N-acetyltransferase